VVRARLRYASGEGWREWRGSNPQKHLRQSSQERIKPLHLLAILRIEHFSSNPHLRRKAKKICPLFVPKTPEPGAVILEIRAPENERPG
jgi:hypothetical protein